MTAYCLIFGLLFILMILGTAMGSVRFSPGETLDALFGRSDDAVAVSVIRNIRLPRVLSAALLGGALAVSGLMLQTFFGNPIAGPFVLGISSGAKLAVAAALIAITGWGWHASSFFLIAAAFAGALASMGVVLLVSGRVRDMSLLIVCGVMIGYICSAITEIAVTFADDSNIVNLHNWSMGSFSGIGWDDLVPASVTVFAAIAASFFLAKPMEAYQMGEDYAKSVGVNVRLFRAGLILVSGVLAACVTAFAGPVSFVGIAVPHLMKRLFGTARPVVMIPACFLGGGVFCLFCDLLARVVFAPNELAIGTVTAVFGAPVVIAMLLGRRKTGR